MGDYDSATEVSEIDASSNPNDLWGDKLIAAYLAEFGIDTNRTLTDEEKSADKEADDLFEKLSAQLESGEAFEIGLFIDDSPHLQTVAVNICQNAFSRGRELQIGNLQETISFYCQSQNFFVRNMLVSIVGRNFEKIDSSKDIIIQSLNENVETEDEKRTYKNAVSVFLNHLEEFEDSEQIIENLSDHSNAAVRWHVVTEYFHLVEDDQEKANTWLQKFYSDIDLEVRRQSHWLYTWKNIIHLPDEQKKAYVIEAMKSEDGVLKQVVLFSLIHRIIKIPNSPDFWEKVITTVLDNLSSTALDPNDLDLNQAIDLLLGKIYALTYTSAVKIINDAIEHENPWMRQVANIIKYKVLPRDMATKLRHNPDLAPEDSFANR